MENLKKYIPIYLRVCRTLTLYFSFLLLSYLAGYPSRSAPILKALITVFVLHTVIRIFAETDRATRDEALVYRENVAPHDRSSREIWRILFRIKPFHFELALLLALTLLLPAELGFTEVLLAIGWPRSAARLLLRAAMVPLLLLSWCFGHYNAFLWWMPKTSHPDTKLTSALILRLLGNGFIYLIGGLILPNFFYAITSLPGFVLALATEFSTLVAVLVCCLPFLLFFAYRVGRMLRIRYTFLRRLKRLCAAEALTLSPIKRPYRSLFKKRSEASFTVACEGKTYHCMLLGAWSRKNPLFFSELGIMQCLHSYRLRRVEYLRFTTQYDFNFEAPAPKILIVNPVSHLIYAGHTYFYREIDTGERIGDYKVYTATGFLGALQRGVLDR